MEAPSSRELELERLLRERERHVQELTDEVGHLRQFLSNQPPPSANDSITLSPALVSVLLPHIRARLTTPTSSSAGGAVAFSSSTVTTALLHRVKLLQEENVELYGLLRHGEVGKLHEEVRGLRRVVQRLEGALKESSQVVASLTDDLEKTQSILPSASAHRPPALSNDVVKNAYASRVNGHGHTSHKREAPQPSPTNADSRSLPAGLRAPKKQRLDRDPPPSHLSDSRSGQGAAGSGSQTGSASSRRDRDRDRGRDRRRSSRSRSPRSRGGKDSGKLDAVEDSNRRTPSREHERNRDRDHDAPRDRGGRDRRERDRPPRANGFSGGKRSGGRTGQDRGQSPDRTLASRMGLSS